MVINRQRYWSQIQTYERSIFFPVIAERDALAIAKSPFVVRLFYSLQSRQQIFLVRFILELQLVVHIITVATDTITGNLEFYREFTKKKKLKICFYTRKFLKL